MLTRMSPWFRGVRAVETVGVGVGSSVLDFRVPVSYSRTIIVFVGIRYKHLRVHDERSESLYT